VRWGLAPGPSAFWLLAGAAGLAACLRKEAPVPEGRTLAAPAPAAPSEAPPAEPAPGRRLLLTGQLDTKGAITLTVPRVPQWNIALRWLAPDGSLVKAGDPVAELDSSNFANELSEKKLAVARAQSDLEQQISHDAIISADKAFALESARTALTKATLLAAVDRDVLPLRDHQERQVARERAQADFARAQDDLASHQKSAALEAQIRRIALEKSQREIETAESAIRELVLRAPRDGLVVTGTHPWFGRKIESGDNVWVGVPIVRLPELATLRVNARLSDVDDGRIAPGMRAISRLDAYPELEFPGVISEISPVAREPSRDSWRRSFQVVVTLERVDLERMRPGMSVRVEVEPSQPQPVAPPPAGGAGGAP
jgi:multidrug efflux pump subunit AcrA (membrane-fusion protein)